MLTPAFRFPLELALVSIYTHPIVPMIATAPEDEADDEEVEHQEVKPEEQAAWSNLMTNPSRLQGPAYHLNPPVFDPALLPTSLPSTYSKGRHRVWKIHR